MAAARRNVWCWVPLLGLALLSASTLRADTLADVLRKSGLAAGPNAPSDLDQPITSYAVEDSRGLFGIAYYRDDGTTQLTSTLHVGVLDKASGSWRQTALPREAESSAASGLSWSLGSAVRMGHTPGYWWVETHLTPSASTTLVLTRQLQPVGVLEGWIEMALANGSFLYQHSLVHFAPTHPSELWLFEAGSGRNRKLYPTAPYGVVRRRYVEEVRRHYEHLGEAWFRENNHPMDPERFDSTVVSPLAADAARTAVAFLVEFGGGSDSAGATPALTVLVVCSDLRGKGRCRETELEAARRAHPGESDRRLLERASASSH